MANTDLELGDVDIVGDDVDIVGKTVKSLLLAGEVKAHNDVHGPSIFRVPNVLKNISPTSYKLRVVSIGPLHRKNRNVKAMEARKGTYLHNLLKSLKLTDKEEVLKACVEKVNASISRIRQSYDEVISDSDGELTRMMVMDGFFVLDFVYNFENRISDVMLFRSILRDLILLENQIPFFVLQDLFERSIMKIEKHASLILHSLDLLKEVNIFVQGFGIYVHFKATTPNHLLGLLHECYHPEEPIKKCFKNWKSQPAVKLDMAGVKFKPIHDRSWLMTIKVESSILGCFFRNCCKPTVRMPMIRIHDDTESIIRNLIVYEQISSQVPTYITSYASAIDDLVDTEEDIAILVEKGVIYNSLNSKQEAANMINNICREIMCMEFFYGEQWEMLDEYCNRCWPKHMMSPAITQLKRTYFGSPWNFIALIAGIILFALTIVQTIFTIYPV